MVVMVADMVRAVAQVAQAVVAVRDNGQAKIAASHDEWLAFFLPANRSLGRGVYSSVTNPRQRKARVGSAG
ncbi:hypothetical protein AB6N16_15825 [Pseudomonas marginalis]